MIIETRAYARAGLLGNPSDGYFGKTISISVRNFGAHISLYETPELQILEHQGPDLNSYRNIRELVESLSQLGYYGADRLIKAAIKKFYEYCSQQNIRLPNRNFTIRYLTTIPRQVGLAGSSAIITATMRALLKFFDIEIPQEILPGIILSAEVDELGINAGLQDRVIQVYEGCVFMDFTKEQMQAKGHGVYQKLEVELLPKLYIAYKTDLSKISGKVLNDIRTRYDNGDSETIQMLEKIAGIAEQGKAAILNKKYAKLKTLINENFDLRRKIMNISESNLELVKTARQCGAPAKFAGSGGSIIGIYENDEMLNQLIVEMKKIRARVIKPYIV
jgi:glucuronokinase